jgi:hypothetical protein
MKIVNYPYPDLNKSGTKKAFLVSLPGITHKSEDRL